jgi:zinc D-Ala-D-Ala carboxypeptidase
MNLSPHFTLEEMTYSDTAIRRNIDNVPSETEITKLTDLCNDVLEPLRTRLSIKFARPIAIKINSGYRNPKLNLAIGGVANSQHCKGEAIDTIATGIDVQGYFNYIKELVKDNIIECDQVINEYRSWIHISYRKGNNRKQFLKIEHNGKGYQPS